MINWAYVSRTEDRSVILEREKRGILTGPDGRMSTNLPEPTAPPSPPADPPAAPTEDEPGAHGFIKEPLKVGDWVRLLRTVLGTPAGSVLQVRSITAGTLIAGERRLTPSLEGDSWERCAPPVLKTADGEPTPTEAQDGSAPPQR